MTDSLAGMEDSMGGGLILAPMFTLQQ
jgi:hypothetical protein